MSNGESTQVAVVNVFQSGNCAGTGLFINGAIVRTADHFASESSESLTDLGKMIALMQQHFLQPDHIRIVKRDERRDMSAAVRPGVGAILRIVIAHVERHHAHRGSLFVAPRRRSCAGARQSERQ